MDETTPFTLHAWESFYVIVGTTAGALTGLQFVVLTLISEAGKIRGTAETFSAFASPNVVHFCAALLVSAIAAAPWHELGAPGIALAVPGALGFVYTVVVLRRARRQRDYKPVLEDWIWHAALPLLAYAALMLAGSQLARASAGASFIVAGSALLLVFVGIHNAWDTVLYVMLERAREREAKAVAERASVQASAAAESDIG
jgi:hypothetical protein